MYGLGVLGTTARFCLARWGIRRSALFSAGGRRLTKADPAEEAAARRTRAGHDLELPANSVLLHAGVGDSAMGEA